jgi:ketosteroid isomerase-like protein
MRCATIAVCLGLACGAPQLAAQGARTPVEVVEAFHAALRAKDTAGALSLLDRGLVVFEFGAIDPTVEAYAFRHLPFDMDLAVSSRWTLESRRVGGEGDERWILSSYRVTGKQSDGAPIDQITLETVIVRRVARLFRIAHFHWSTSDAAFQARAQSQRQQQGKP